MEVFVDLAQYAMPIAIVGGVLFFLGFLLKGNAKKSTVSGVFSSLFLTVGSIMLIFSISTWVTQAIGDWSSFSSRMM